MIIRRSQFRKYSFFIQINKLTPVIQLLLTIGFSIRGYQPKTLLIRLLVKSFSNSLIQHEFFNFLLYENGTINLFMMESCFAFSIGRLITNSSCLYFEIIEDWLWFIYFYPDLWIKRNEQLTKILLKYSIVTDQIEELFQINN